MIYVAEGRDASKVGEMATEAVHFGRLLLSLWLRVRGTEASRI